MFDDKGYSITNTYDLAVHAFELVKSRIGLNIKVHGDEDLLNQGQIFLFNHFARFETLIPPYILYRQTETYCRSVADHNLFNASPRLNKFLSEVGAVPNDLPGLLPYLAAEILRGRKVVIFPEGAIIKDRRVMDEEGRLGVFSPSQERFRKHHRGAAVLALILDVFKHRIRDLAANGDEERLGHWLDALDIATPEHLLEQARKPSVIVPATITFYPIHLPDKLLQRGAEILARGRRLPPRLLEELAVEGSILVRDTDMDIRLGDPIQPNRNWNWWYTRLMRRYFLGIDALEEFFSQREVKGTLAEKLLMRAIGSESRRIRDAYMRAIYDGITVNPGHLAASLISQLMDRGEKNVSFHVLHTALYLALKTLQGTPGVHLHRSLLWPDRYQGMVDGVSEDLDRFLQTCEGAGLLKKTSSGYDFLDKLREEHDFHQVRLENPLMVYANEAAPVKAVGAAVAAALAQASGHLDRRELGELLFDDELRAHAWNRAYYGKQRYQEINERETATRDANPYLLIRRDGKSVPGVLLVHGFLSSPAELREFGDKVHGEGYNVLGVRLTGHGTSPWDLHGRSWHEWLKAVQRGFHILSQYSDRVAIVGFSSGGALALLLAAARPQRLAGIVSVAAPYFLQEKNTAFAPLLDNVNRLVEKVSGREGLSLFRPNPSALPDINYASIPVSGLKELLDMMAAMKKSLAQVEAPVVLIQGDEDVVVKPESATLIHDGLTGARQRELHWIPGGPHGLITRDEGETHTLLLEALRSMTGQASPQQQPIEQENMLP